jgi:hypothetical protein
VASEDRVLCEKDLTTGAAAELAYHDVVVELAGWRELGRI